MSERVSGLWNLAVRAFDNLSVLFLALCFAACVGALLAMLVIALMHTRPADLWIAGTVLVCVMAWRGMVRLEKYSKEHTDSK